MILRPLFWFLLALGVLSLVFAGLTGDFRVSLQFLSVFAPLTIFAYLGLGLAILVHEMGHVVAGERAGLRFSAMHIGGLVVRRDGQGRLVFSRIKRAFAGGLAVMDFPEKGDKRAMFRRCIAGGPMASLLWCALTITLYFSCEALMPPSRQGYGYLVNEFTFGLFFTSILLLPGSLWPRPIRGLMTDAYLLRRFREDTPESDRLVSIFTLAQRIRSGERARDWPRDRVESLIGIEDGSAEEIQSRLIAYYHYRDSGDLLRAKENLDWARILLPSKGAEEGYFGQAVLWQTAFHTAEDGDPAEARAIVKRIKKHFDPINTSRHTAWAAIHHAEGNPAEALKEIALARKALERLARTLPGNTDAAAETLDQLERRAKG